MEKFKNLCIIEGMICDSCYPNHWDDIQKLATHLIDKNGNWKGGWSMKKYKEFSAISDEYSKDKKTSCLMLDDGCGYICKKCLLELTESM